MYAVIGRLVQMHGPSMLLVCCANAGQMRLKPFDRIWPRYLRKLINKHVSNKIQAHTGNTNEIKAGTPTAIVLQTRSDV